jgi:hypothetical protein
MFSGKEKNHARAIVADDHPEVVEDLRALVEPEFGITACVAQTALKHRVNSKEIVMATKADFTADEWKQIQRAPFMAGLAVVAASPSGPFRVIKEIFAVGKMLAEVKTQGSSNDLLKALVADLETGAREQSAPAELHGKTPDQVRSYAIESLREITALIEKKAKPEAQGFNQWLVSVAQKVSEAAKEGGFLGFGGTQVSEQEAATIKELSTALGVKV